ncbi:unnamed protein product [Larinioides sclopetarius]
MSKAIDCVDQASNECSGKERNQEIDNERQKLRRYFSQDCLVKDLKIPGDIAQCIKGLKLELMKCVSDGIAIVLENIDKMPDETGIKEDEIKCSLYRFVVKCGEQKVEDNCGTEVAQLILERLFDARKEIKESCGKEGIKGALRGLAYDIVKRRK